MGQMLDDRQAKPGAAELARAGFIDAIKSLKDPGKLLFCDADAGVRDF